MGWRVWVALFILMCAASAQPSAVLEDLRRRAGEALLRIPRAENWTQALAGQPALRDKLRRSLAMDSLPAESIRAFVYEPSRTQARGPAVVLVRPHEDPRQAATRVLPLGLARLGLVVVEVDAFAYHERLNRLVDGIVPQSFAQAGVDAAFAYLRSRQDIDRKRIGLVGSTISTTIAAGLQGEFAAVAVLDGTPDFSPSLSANRYVSARSRPSAVCGR